MKRLVIDEEIKYQTRWKRKAREDEKFREKEREANREWRSRNTAKISAQKKEYYLQNKTDIQKQKKLRYVERRQRHVAWDKELTDLVYCEARDLAKTRTKLLGERYEVDHVLPLKGKTVSGLHVWNNIQVIPARVNRAKYNKVQEKTRGGCRDKLKS
jgi:hypothetical protein